MGLETWFDLNTNRRHERHDVLQLFSQHLHDSPGTINNVYICSDNVILYGRNGVNSVQDALQTRQLTNDTGELHFTSGMPSF